MEVKRNVAEVNIKHKQTDESEGRTCMQQTSI